MPTHEMQIRLKNACSAAWTAPQRGTQLGEFHLMLAIREVGSAQVWRAMETRFGDGALVAIKIFFSGELPSSEREMAAMRFWDGAEAIHRLQDSPRIVKLKDGPTIQGCYVWFAMECIEDGTLADVLRSGRLSNAAKVALIDDMIAAIAHAHACDVVHRDIRPENVLIKNDPGAGGNGGLPRAVLADFDIAYFDHRKLQRSLSTGAALGVARYLPPDLEKANEADLPGLMRRKGNDLYALSMVVYDMFTSTATPPPSKRNYESFMESLTGNDRILRRRVARLCTRGLQRNPQTNPHVEKPEERFDTIEDLKACWEQRGLAGPWSDACLGFVLFSVTATILVLVDWCLWVFRDEPTTRILLGSAGTLFGVSGAVALLRTIFDTLRGKFPAWRLKLGEWLEGRPQALPVLVVLALIVFSLGIRGTQFSGRLHTHEISRGAGCTVIDARGKELPSPTSDLLQPLSDAVHVVLCPKEHMADVRSGSLLAQGPPVQAK